MSELSPAERAVIASIEVVRVAKKHEPAREDQTDVVVRAKTWNLRASKTKALELLMRHLALLDLDPDPPAAPGPVFILPPGTHVQVHR